MRKVVLLILLTALAATPLWAAEPPCPATPCPTTPKPMVTKVFAVMDLVVPIPDSAAPAPMKHVDVLTAAPKALPAPVSARMVLEDGTIRPVTVTVAQTGVVLPQPFLIQPRPKTPAHHAADLCRMVVSKCSPATWKVNGGAGTIDFHEIGGALVVCNAPEVLGEVDTLLTALRKEQECTIAIECRLVTVTPQSVKLFDNPGLDGAGLTCLSVEQTARFLTEVQADRKGNVVQMPKLSVFNGQSARMMCGDTVTKVFTTGMNIENQGGQTITVPKQVTEQFGTTLWVQPTLSADRKYVRLAFVLSQRELGGPVELMPVTHTVTPVFEGGSKGQPIPFTQFLQQPAIVTRSVDRSATLPDGGTVAVRVGTKLVESRSEFGPPVLSNIPYLNRLFKNVGISHEPREVVALLTTRVMRTEPECSPPQAACCEQVKCCAESSKVVALVASYREACAAGKTEAAMKLALQALALDPTCFAPTTKPEPRPLEVQIRR